jgi:dTMP kinase
LNNNSFKGKFIAIDGPNGGGKSTLLAGVKSKLEKLGYELYITKEPSETQLGKYTREYAENHGGLALACLVAANRYEHLSMEIILNLEAGKIVFSDRYILSSLILQRMDGVSEEFILSINNEVILPDLQIAIFVDENIIQQRLSERLVLTRFEEGNQSLKELHYLELGVQSLEKIGVNVLRIINNDRLDMNIETIVNHIINLKEKQ